MTRATPRVCATALVILLAALPAGAQRARPSQLPPTPKPEIPPELVKTEPSGLSAAAVGARAARTNFSVKSQEALLEAAAARVDQAWVSFLPRLSAVMRYTRVSNFNAENLLAVPSGLNLVFTTQPPSNMPGLDPTGQVSVPVPVVAFPPVLDNYLLQGTLTVPLTDYFLRIAPTYSAATNSRDAAKYELNAGRINASTDGQVAFYTWLRARGAAVVAIQAHYDQRAHLVDATNQFNVGGASKADVLRAETAVAAAELQVTRAKDFADLGEKQVRIAVHAHDGDRLVPAESLDAPLAPLSESLPRLLEEAFRSRYELKSLQANVDATKSLATAARAAILPSLSGFADAIYANPNPRRIPLTDQWFPTWDVGAQLTWSPNDALGGAYGGADYTKRAAALDAQRRALRDGIELEVQQAYQAAIEGDVALEATRRELASAEEAYRAAHDLFQSGRIPSATLTDAETDLTRARLDSLNSKADARIARVRLQRAVGRGRPEGGRPSDEAPAEDSP